VELLEKLKRAPLDASVLRMMNSLRSVDQSDHGAHELKRALDASAGPMPAKQIESIIAGV